MMMLNGTSEAQDGHRMDDGIVDGGVGEMGGAMEVPSPVVFQCSECKTIVGDSSTISSMDAVNRTMTIKRKTEAIVVSSDLQTSTNESDFGSCNQALGQVYRTTSSNLDYLRNLYTFHSDQLIFYQLFPEPEIFESQQQNPVETVVTPSVAEVKTALPKSAANQSNLEIEILKLQKFCTFLHDRVLKMEDELERFRNATTKAKKHH